MSDNDWILSHLKNKNHASIFKIMISWRLLFDIVNGSPCPSQCFPNKALRTISLSHPWTSCLPASLYITCLILIWHLYSKLCPTWLTTSMSNYRCWLLMISLLRIKHDSWKLNPWVFVSKCIYPLILETLEPYDNLGGVNEHYILPNQEEPMRKWVKKIQEYL